MSGEDHAYLVRSGSSGDPRLLAELLPACPGCGKAIGGRIVKRGKVLWHESCASLGKPTADPRLVLCPTCGMEHPLGVCP